jgi:hypothetical protein
LQCPGVAIEVRTHLLQNSHAGRLQKKTTILTPPTNSNLGGKSLSSVCRFAGLGTKRLKQISLIRAIEVHTHLLQNSQAGRLQKKTTILTPPTNSNSGGKSLSSVCMFAGLGTKRLKQISLICTTNNGKVTRMSIDEMKRVYKAKVEAVLYRHEPLMCLLDPMVIAAITLCHPPMKSFLPQNTATIYSN